jgi:hypothetical protein
MLMHIAKNGINRHLTDGNFRIFEKGMTKAIKNFKKQSGWKSEYFEEYLLQMEQFIFT